MYASLGLNELKVHLHYTGVSELIVQYIVHVSSMHIATVSQDLPSLMQISMVSCKKGPTRHAYAWQIGPFWKDTLDMLLDNWYTFNTEKVFMTNRSEFFFVWLKLYIHIPQLHGFDWYYCKHVDLYKQESWNKTKVIDMNSTLGWSL